MYTSLIKTEIVTTEFLFLIQYRFQFIDSRSEISGIYNVNIINIPLLNVIANIDRNLFIPVIRS